jgi:glucan 1,4-alpha-glucosidase
VIYSPVQMAADLPEHYEGQPGFQFIQDVGTDWSETRVLDAVIGDYAVIARKKRGSEEWFIGAVTDENARDIVVDLDFLSAPAYKVSIYADGPNAHWNDNPTDLMVTTRTRTVIKGDVLPLHLAPGGGAALSFFPATR